MIKRIVNSFVEVIKNIDSYNRKINEIEYIPINEKERILNEFNSDINNYECDKLYHVEFSKIAKQYPERNAIVCNEVKISYGQLEEMSNSLAHYLRECGITRNDIVPIISERSHYYIIGTLAVSKAGGAFLPVDKKLPIDRIEYILEEVKPKIILFYNTQYIIEQIDDKNYHTYNLENHNYDINNEYINNINEVDDTSYVLFTSGTTGKPKGALVSHFNIYNYVRGFEEGNEIFCIYNLFMKSNSIQNVLAVSNFSFDVSHIEITISLVHGLNIVMADDNVSNDLNMLSQYILDNNVEFINTTPTRFKLFMENSEFRKSLKIVKAVVLTGEDLPFDLCIDIHRCSDCIIYNGYGPTECAVDCTFKEINEVEEPKITIGKPLCNCKVYILDKNLNVVPIGVEGEIFIGGYGVGKGYLNRPELTKEKFVECPFHDGNPHDLIMYRTGDLGKWMENGEIDYLGRIDFQVKIHGQRIELSEIENTIKEIEGIEYCAVIDKVKESGDKYLVCYYISGKGISGREIRNHLKSKLPLYMVPNYFISIENIPVTSNGKLNRKALPEPNISDLITEQYIAPETEIEKIVCKIYCSVFNIDENEIGKMSDFYELGGDSLNAIRMTSKVEKELNIKINIKDILSNSSVFELSKFIENIVNNGNEIHESKIIKRYNSKEFPITSQQLGVYIDS
ncbi:hypothetical protein PIROE2DRAFT_19334, partial [Piromyces sp. E2]